MLVAGLVILTWERNFSACRVSFFAHNRAESTRWINKQAEYVASHFQKWENSNLRKTSFVKRRKTVSIQNVGRGGRHLQLMSCWIQQQRQDPKGRSRNTNLCDKKTKSIKTFLSISDSVLLPHLLQVMFGAVHVPGRGHHVPLLRQDYACWKVHFQSIFF